MPQCLQEALFIARSLGTCSLQSQPSEMLWEGRGIPNAVLQLREKYGDIQVVPGVGLGGKKSFMGRFGILAPSKLFTWPVSALANLNIWVSEDVEMLDGLFWMIQDTGVALSRTFIPHSG
ncbi:hypothetical protein Tco_0729354 [Tanacetum coccineum]|uniref:Uncharacterized protein n=1 Tax=Tanacetum coccineum TaxID=301880 RepID=A0ABQ4YRS8_9ASTR